MELTGYIVALAGMGLNLLRFVFEHEKGKVSYLYIFGNILLMAYMGYSYFIDRSDLDAINKEAVSYLGSDNQHYKIYDEVVSRLRSCGYDEAKYSRSIVELVRLGVIGVDEDVNLYDTTYNVSHKCRGYYIKSSFR